MILECDNNIEAFGIIYIDFLTLPKNNYSKKHKKQKIYFMYSTEYYY